MFKMPQNPDIAADGQSDDHPLRLEGVKSDDFRQLLRVMYPRYETDHRSALLLLIRTSQWHWRNGGSHGCYGTVDIGIAAFHSVGYD